MSARPTSGRRRGATHAVSVEFDLSQAEVRALRRAWRAEEEDAIYVEAAQIVDKHLTEIAEQLLEQLGLTICPVEP